MTVTTSEFIDHCRDGARAFIQTAIVIDDEAVLGPEDTTEPLRSRRAVRASGGILGEENVAGSPSTEQNVEEDNDDSKEAEPEQLPPYALDARKLTEAFLDASVICGLYKPRPGDEMVALSTKAALHADLVIIDWFLEEKNSVKAKEIIRRIVQSDSAINGRLRLIVVYTSQPGRSTMAQEVLEALEIDENLRDRLKLTNDRCALASTDTRICFLNKPNTVGGGDVEIVEEANLPERLIREFAQITEGVLATFAVRSIAAVRGAAHHIVSVFRKELDGAYVAHRCALPDPENAKDFATNLIAGELRNVISVNSVAEKYMDVGTLNSWIDHITSVHNHSFTNHLGVQAPPGLVKQFIEFGESKLDDSSADQRLTSGAGPVSKKKAIDCHGVYAIFYGSVEEAWSRSREFARLATFKREANGRTRFPPEWRPMLTLGSVVRFLGPSAGIDSSNPDSIGSEFLLCVQPRCDSFRLVGVTAFPFQTIERSTGKFNLVVMDATSGGVELLVNLKPKDSVMISFRSDQTFRCVRAEPDGQEGFVFTDVRGRRFLWVGDIQDLKAQRDASELASRVHSVGLQDFEWLRRARTGKISRNVPGEFT